MKIHLVEAHWRDGTVEQFYYPATGTESADAFNDWKDTAHKMLVNGYPNPVVEVKRFLVELWPLAQIDRRSRPEDRVTAYDMVLRLLNRDNFAMATTLADHWQRKGYNDDVNRSI